jgi:hypothetical protein
MSEPESADAWGTVQTHAVKGSNVWCEVRLDDGREVKSLVRKHVLRDAYLILAGDRVRVRFKESSWPIIVELTRKPTTDHST